MPLSWGNVHLEEKRARTRPAAGEHRPRRTGSGLPTGALHAAGHRAHAERTVPGLQTEVPKVMRNQVPRPLGMTRAGTVQDACESRKS
jgi:hypothetical protein